MKLSVVKASTGDLVVNVSVTGHFSVRDLQWVILDKLFNVNEVYDCNQLNLLLRDRILLERELLFDCGVKDGDVLSLVITPSTGHKPPIGS